MFFIIYDSGNNSESVWTKPRCRFEYTMRNLLHCNVPYNSIFSQCFVLLFAVYFSSDINIVWEIKVWIQHLISIFTDMKNDSADVAFRGNEIFVIYDTRSFIINRQTLIFHNCLVCGLTSDMRCFYCVTSQKKLKPKGK